MTSHESDKKQPSSKQLKKVSSKKPRSPSRQTRTVATASFEGPIPPPNILSAYDQVEPGLANRIVSMAEDEAIHRRGIENRVVAAQILETTLGQILGFGIGTITIGGGVISSIYGSAILGTGICTVGVVGLVSVFIYGRKENNSS